MRGAFLLLGVLTVIVYTGAFIAFSTNVEAPASEVEDSLSLRETDASLARPQGSTIITNDKQERMSLVLSSPAFADDASIPQKYTCDGENVSPEFRISNAPEGTQSFVLLMDDPDIPVSVKKTRGIQNFDHWVVYNIPGDTTSIPEGGTQTMTTGMNTRGTNGYTGPCPPDREHRYFFRLYALRGILSFAKTPTLAEVEEAAVGMMLAKAELTGRYERARE